MNLPDRLVGMMLPAISLRSTRDRAVDLASLGAGRTVLYCYPRTSEPGKAAPTDWDIIPGARGCTPQACAFRDHHQDLAKAGAAVFGVSTQSTAYQQEMAARLHLPFEILSDEHFRLTDALQLPTFVADGMRLIERLTLIARDGRIETVFHPIANPETNAGDTLQWLLAHPL